MDKEYKKSYKGLALWVLLFLAATIGPAFIPGAEADVMTRLICLATLWSCFALMVWIWVTEQVYWINGVTFDCAENPMGIKWFRLDLEGDRGTFAYENAQGEKSFPFGFGHNEFAKFPEEGYADLVATIPEPGNRYDAAFSADWAEPQKLRIRVQIIDKYFGNLAMVFGFRDAKTVSVRMTRKAEAFLHEYEGIANAKARA